MIFVKNLSAADITAGGSAIKTDIIHGFIEAVFVNRTNSTTVDIDESSGLARKIVDLADGTSDVTVYPRFEETDNTGASLAPVSFTRAYVDGTLTITATEPCIIYISVSQC